MMGLERSRRGGLAGAAALALAAALLLLLGPVSKAGAELPVDVHGFWDLRAGIRVDKDPHQRDVSLGETRLQLDLSREFDWGEIRVRPDLLWDDVDRTRHIDLEEGAGMVDLREANVLWYPTDNIDVKIGRQILTWGTGDLVFLNDLFPKDWVSFLIGRDEEYLKAPSDAVKVSIFGELADLDLVYTPRFDPDRYIKGERVSYWNGAMQEITGRNGIVHARIPNDWFDDDELALRLHKLVRGYELALYSYFGYWKSPAGQTPRGRAAFPHLNVYGASIRGDFLKGVGNMEVAYYDSTDDDHGDDPMVRNSEWRFLLGYQQELVTDFTASVQYYLESMVDHHRYRRSLPPGMESRDKNHHVFTLRLTRLLMNQNLILSLFTFYSPSDRDGYLRPSVTYKVTDHWTVATGGNLFFRNTDATFYGQFHSNSNLYASIRYSF